MQHKKKFSEAFAASDVTERQSNIPLLIYSEEFPPFIEARRREAQIKRWPRAKKEAIVSAWLDANKMRGGNGSRRQ